MTLSQLHDGESLPEIISSRALGNNVDLPAGDKPEVGGPSCKRKRGELGSLPFGTPQTPIFKQPGRGSTQATNRPLETREIVADATLDHDAGATVTDCGGTNRHRRHGSRSSRCSRY